MNFEKFLRIPFLQNISGRLLLLFDGFHDIFTSNSIPQSTLTGSSLQVTFCRMRVSKKYEKKLEQHRWRSSFLIKLYASNKLASWRLQTLLKWIPSHNIFKDFASIFIYSWQLLKNLRTILNGYFQQAILGRFHLSAKFCSMFFFYVYVQIECLQESEAAVRRCFMYKICTKCTK